MSRLAFLAALTVIVGLTACSDPEATPSPSPASPAATAIATGSPSPRPSPPTSPSATPSPAADGTYLALGDSLAAGVGATRPEEDGYVARLYRALSEPESMPRAAQLVNLAIGGETSTSMIASGQLAAAVDAIRVADPPVTLVTLDIGGNDLLSLLRTDACRANPRGAECLQLLAIALGAFEANYRHILGDLTTALDEHTPEATLAVMTYFNPFSGTDASLEAAAELALLGTDGRLDCDLAAPDAQGMNDSIACAGEELGAVAVDVQPAFAGLGLELTHILSEDIHANDRGYMVIADVFVEALKASEP